jgi:hypothetical protein
VVNVTSSAGFNVGDSIQLVGAGGSGGVTLAAVILSISGANITLDTPAVISVSSAVFAKNGAISNNLISNVFTVSGQVAGQVIDPTSAQVWLDSVLVQTLTSGFGISPNSNLVSLSTPSSTVGTISISSSILTVASATGLQIGDSITIVGAGVASTTLTTTIAGISGTTITVSTQASTTATAQAVTKVLPVNLNSITSTLRVEPGDQIQLTYLDVGSVAHVFTSHVQSVVTSSGANGTIVSLSLVDSLPGSTVVSAQNVLLVVQKQYSDQLMPITNPISGATNYSTTALSTLGQITINPGSSLIYGSVISGNVYVAYKALRTDLSGNLLTFQNEADLIGQLGDTSDNNPLGLACQIALANTTGPVNAIAIASNDIAGHSAALTVAQGYRLYFLVPLTQDVATLAAYKAHCDQMSTPANAAWRIALVNTAIPTLQTIGQWNVAAPNVNSGSNAVTLIGSSYVLTSSNATFISDGVSPGDSITFTAATPSGQVGVHQVLSVISNQQLVLNTNIVSSGVSYYTTRALSKSQQATAVAAASSQFNDARVVHVQPDTVGVSVNGVTKYLPGYYLAAGLAGMGTGFAVQQGFTNVGIAGISDLRNSNFYFAKSDLNNMAGAGTCLFVQDTQSGIPYCRHELTTNMTTLNYRELLLVKEIDYLSYYYYDILKGFIGSWNITPSSINTLRQTITAGSELLKSQGLPKVGAVLLGYSITTLKQDAVNTDHVTCVIAVAVGTPMNYIDLSLVV